MKKIWVLLVMFCFVTISHTFAGNLVKNVCFSPYPILINGERYYAELPVLSYQDRTYVALREFSEMINVSVDFVDNTIVIDGRAIDNVEEIEDGNDENFQDVEKQDTDLVEEKVYESNNYTASQVVYITSSGTKYHLKNNCSKGTYYSVLKSEAIEKGYEPCKRCVGK